MAAWILSLLGALGSFLGGMLGKITGKKDASAQELAASNATVQSQLDQERAADDELKKAAVVQRTANAQRVRSDPTAGEVHADRRDPINLDDNGQPDPDLRD